MPRAWGTVMQAAAEWSCVFLFFLFCGLVWLVVSKVKKFKHFLFLIYFIILDAFIRHRVTVKKYRLVARKQAVT